MTDLFTNPSVIRAIITIVVVLGNVGSYLLYREVPQGLENMNLIVLGWWAFAAEKTVSNKENQNGN
jgi:hypothetical protein